jgi:DNA-binding LytR/AlgR family response regulator
MELLKSPNTITVFDMNNISALSKAQAILLGIKDIFYIESVDLKTFVYAEKNVYRSKQKLYEIEEILSGDNFFRISKQAILNLQKIKSVAPAGNGRFQAILLNEEKIIISRQYVAELKRRFGL